MRAWGAPGPAWVAVGGWPPPPAAGVWPAALACKSKAENLFNRVGERPAIEKPIAMGRVQRAESRCASQAEDADLARTENLFGQFGERPGKRKADRRTTAAVGLVQMLVAQDCNDS